MAADPTTTAILDAISALPDGVAKTLLSQEEALWNGTEAAWWAVQQANAGALQAKEPLGAAKPSRPKGTTDAG